MTATITTTLTAEERDNGALEKSPLTLKYIKEAHPRSETREKGMSPVDQKNWYTKLVDEAPHISGLDCPYEPIEEIKWMDLERIKRALHFYDDYFALWAISTSLGMAIVSLAVRRISTVIYQTNRPLDKQLQFRRFFTKLRGVKKVLQVILNPEEARKYFYRVRRVHAMAQRRIPNIGKGATIPEILVWKEEPWMEELAAAVRADYGEIKSRAAEEENKCIPIISWEGSVHGALSQFDMVHLTLAFFGPVWVAPNRFGMKKGLEDEKMKDLIHFWAVTAKLLGLRDEFNIYIQPEKEKLDRIVEHIHVYSMKNVDSCTTYLGHVTMSGIKDNFPIITHKSGLQISLAAFGCSKKGQIWKLMGFWDKVNFWILMSLFWLMSQSKIVRVVVNKLFIKWMDFTYNKCMEDVRRRG